MQWLFGIDADQAYETLASDAEEATAFGVTLKVCSLAALRQMKRAAGRPRDLQDLQEIVRTGVMVTDLLENLLESLSDDAFPGESPAEVLLEMLAGTIRPATAAAGDETVGELIAVLGAICDRILEDLEAATALARARGDS